MSRPRTPGTVYAIVTLVLVILIALVAMSTNQPPPPTIAEFAPQSVENITESPEDQSFGALGASVAPTPTPTADPLHAGTQPIDIPRVRKCVGDPPRQIEDPQSPPCVPYWAGDNGGSTYKGVTRDEIRIAHPAANGGHVKLIESFFNRRFEFYGRKLKLINTTAKFTGSDAETANRAGAVAADEEYKVFASTDSENSGGAHYRTELARRRILSVGEQTQYTDADMAELRPYMWQYPMGNDRMLSLFGEWICRRLAGRSAAHAGDPTLAGKQRVFGAIVDQMPSPKPLDLRPLHDELARCSTTLVATVRTTASNGSAQEYANAILNLRDAGVTSAICFCYALDLGPKFMTTATAQRYFPEWLQTPYYLLHIATWTRAAPKEQTAHLFGITTLPRDVTVTDDVSFWAMRESDPGYTPNAEEDTSYYRQQVTQMLYRNLLVLASGIQMAGPQLTPETFEAALHRTRFPNPDHPTQPGKVGFPTGTFSMTTDAAEVWWSSSAQGPYLSDSAGAFCFTNNAARYAKGAWPSDEPALFQGPCVSGA